MLFSDGPLPYALNFWVSIWSWPVLKRICAFKCPLLALLNFQLTHTFILLWFLPASRYSSRTEVIGFCEKRIAGIELSGDGIVRSLVWKVLANLVKHNGVWTESSLLVWFFKWEQIDLFSFFRSLNLWHALQESMGFFFYT